MATHATFILLFLCGMQLYYATANSDYTTISSTIVTEHTTAQTAFCDQTTCDACCTFYNSSFAFITDEIVVQASPYFFILTENNPVSVNYDSVCATFFRLMTNTYLFFYSVTNKDESSYVQVYIFKKSGNSENLFGFTGFTASSPAINYGYYVGMACSGEATLYTTKTQYAAEGCDSTLDMFVPAVSYSAELTPPQSCVAEARSTLGSYMGKDNVIRLPQQLPVQCVAQFGGQPVINADKLFTNDNIKPISYP